ncbi:UPF0691 protein-like protein [Biomphalaria glabrata]
MDLLSGYYQVQLFMCGVYVRSPDRQQAQAQVLDQVLLKFILFSPCTFSSLDWPVKRKMDRLLDIWFSGNEVVFYHRRNQRAGHVYSWYRAMEERHILTDHLTEHNARAAGDSTGTVQYDQATNMAWKLQENQTQELVRTLDSSYDTEHKRFRGICLDKGNAVFTDTPVAPPAFRRQLDLCTASYERPCQHPMYKTSNSQYGLQPLLAHTPIEFHARDMQFTTRQALGGMYEDYHLTTEMDKEIV